MSIVYKVKTASEKEIGAHLQCCSDDFNRPLGQRVNIEQYAKKIFDNAVTFEAWDDNRLIGLVAAYFNDPEGNFSGHITSVSVDSNFMRKGIATSLMNNCLEHAKGYGIKNITLEVSSGDHLVMDFYKKFGFKDAGTRGDFLLMKR
jgi:ribosomal protein S18 acetylase RimI-like enzyme